MACSKFGGSFLSVLKHPGNASPLLRSRRRIELFQRHHSVGKRQGEMIHPRPDVAVLLGSGVGILIQDFGITSYVSGELPRLEGDRGG